MQTQLDKTLTSKILASFVIVILMLTVAPIPPAYAATRVSTANGAWNATATWDCNCIPAETDDVVINSNVSTGAVRVNNLTIQAGSTLSASSIVTMDGTTLILNGAFTGTGQLILNANNATLDGSGTFSGDRIDAGANTNKSILPTANLTISYIDIRTNNTVTNNGTVTATRVAGVDATSTWVNAAGSTLNVNSDLLTTGTLTATASPNTVNYNGAAQTIKATTYHHLTLSGSGAKTMTGVSSINGDFTLSGTASTTGISTGMTIGETFTLGSGTTFTGGAFTHSVAGNWMNNGGTFTNTGSTINFNGTSTQTIGGSNPTTFNNLTIATVASVQLTAGVAPVINTNITVNGGIIMPDTVTVTNDGAATITLGANGKIQTADADGVTGSASTSFGSNFATSSLDTNGTVEYNQSGNQTITGRTYNNLTTSGSGTKMPGGAMIVNGTVTIGLGTTLDELTRTMTLPGNSTLVVNGMLDFTSSIGMIRDGTSGVTTLTMGTNGLIRTVDNAGLGPGTNLSLSTQIGGTWNITSLSTNGTVEYYFTGAQAITDIDYNHLTITNTGTKTWSLATNHTVNGNLTINTAAPLTLSGTFSVIVKGNWSNSGTFTAGTSTVNFNGSAAQIISGSSVTTFNNLTLDNTAGFSLSGVDATVTNTFNFANGKISTETNTLILPTGGTISGAGAGKYVYGNLQKAFNTGSGQSFTFEIGDASNYTPAQLVNFNVTSAGNITANTTASRHPQYLTAGIGDNYVSRYWTLTPGGLATSGYDITVTFVSGDLVGAPNTSALIIQKCSGSPTCTWSNPASHSSTSTTVTGTGFTTFSDFFTGEGGTPTPVTLSYFASHPQGSDILFEWSTATETGNIGFNLYVESNGQRTQINDELIPSNAVDSLERQDYSLSVDVTGDVFYLEEVSVFGETNLHGPFQLGEEYGSRVNATPIDWAAIQAEHGLTPASPQRILDQVQPTSDEPVEDGASETPQDPNTISEESPPAPEILPAVPPRNGRTTSAPPIVNLQVRQTGLYRVTYEILRDAGYDLSGVLSKNLQLTNRGQVMPIYFKGSSKFGPGAYFEFYGQALDTVYTDTNIYSLQVASSSAPRIASSNSAPRRGLTPPAAYTETMTVNNQRAYASFYALEDGWYDTSMLVYTTSKTWSFPFEVNYLADASAPATLELVVWGVTDWPQSPDHHLLVSLNGVPLASELFNGLTVQTIIVNLPAGTLQAGSNSLELTLPGDTGVKYDMVNLDKFSVTYQRTFQAQNGRLSFTATGKIFKVTDLPAKNVTVYRLDKNSPVRINTVQVQASGSNYNATFAGTGASTTYLVSTVGSLYVPVLQAPRQPANFNQPAQYLVIAYPDFIGGLQPLIQARQAQGLSVNVVDVNDVYAQYSYGIFDPQAIQKYIAYAYENLGTQFVLLVGGDTYDYRNYLGRNSVSFIPSLYASTSEHVRLVPVDPLFADVNGDNVPDLAIGRFPVRTSAELDLMVNKTLAYANKNYARTAVFASDKFDGIVNFKDINLGFAATLPASWTVENIHLDDLSAPAAQAQLIAAMNRGTALVTFTGHSGPTTWTFSNLFTTKTAAALTNAGRPFVAVQWGCWNIYHVDPVNNYLVQSLLFSGDQGAAAVLGSVTLTDSESEDRLGQLLTARLVTPGRTIGQALQQAKAELAQSHPDLLDVLLGWSLMGDPALVVEP